MVADTEIMDITPIDEVFSRLGISNGSSEGAGTLCGLICAKMTVSYDDWISAMQVGEADQLVPDTDSSEISPDSNGIVLLQSLYRETLRQMNDPEFDFQLLLPDDDEPIGIRANALADWCRGFLYGLALGGVRNLEHLSSDVSEISRDFIEFSKLSHADVEESESDESDYFELVEYVRMGVLLIYAELQPDHHQRPDDVVLH